MDSGERRLLNDADAGVEGDESESGGASVKRGIVLALVGAVVVMPQEFLVSLVLCSFVGVSGVDGLFDAEFREVDSALRLAKSKRSSDISNRVLLLKLR